MREREIEKSNRKSDSLNEEGLRLEYGGDDDDYDNNLHKEHNGLIYIYIYIYIVYSLFKNLKALST